MTESEISHCIKNSGWNFQSCGAGLPYQFKRGNSFYLDFGNKDLITCNEIKLLFQTYLPKREETCFTDIELLSFKMSQDLYSLRAIILYINDLIKNS